MKLNKTFLEVGSERLACEYELSDNNAVILHGAGPATTRKKFYAIAEEIIKHGIGVVLFDFSGHGESSGKLSELSLARRAEQAEQVIKELCPAKAHFTW